MYDFSKLNDTKKYFDKLITDLGESKITGVYSELPFCFKRKTFIYMQDTPVYIIFDNGKCLVIEYYEINKLRIEYRSMTKAELALREKSTTKDLFNRTTSVYNQISATNHTETSGLPYEKLTGVELKRVTEKYSSWINGNLTDGIQPTEETFNEIKFIMKNGKSFTVCAADAEDDGYSLILSEDAIIGPN